MAAGEGTAAAAAATAAVVRFTPLLGVHGRGPLAYLLELDGFTLLLDCGWNDAYDPALLAPLVAALPRVDAGARVWLRAGVGALRCAATCGRLLLLLVLFSFRAWCHCKLHEPPSDAAAPLLPRPPTPHPAVLLSHSDPTHLGALPYLVGRCGLAAPVYATSPVHKMGQMAMYDQYLSRQVWLWLWLLLVGFGWSVGRRAWCRWPCPQYLSSQVGCPLHLSG